MSRESASGWRSSCRSTPVVLFITFCLAYLGAIRYCETKFYRDPTSFFFAPPRAYARGYSDQRHETALQWISQANISTGQGRKEKIRSSPNPVLCVALSTVRRDGTEQYIRAAVGSLVEGLSPQEQKDIHLSVQISNSDPSLHPIYHEPWLSVVADSVVTYSPDQPQYDDVRHWESQKDYRTKALYDYTHLLRHCLLTGAQFIAMVEDDTLAVTGWYDRLRHALEELQSQQQHDYAKWLYVRLFYTEEFLGWNSEEWPQYLAASCCVSFGVLAFLLILRRLTSRLKTISIKTQHIFTISLVCVPACIILYFLAGRVSMQPLRPGLVSMPKFGCCGQGLVFSHAMAPKVISHLDQQGSGFIDTLLEQYADEQKLDRYAIAPSLLQHIGSKSSKEDDVSDKAKSRATVAEKIWNFGFEGYNDHTIRSLRPSNL